MIEVEVRKNDQEYIWEFITDWRHKPVSGWRYHIWWSSTHKELSISTAEVSRYAGELFWKELWHKNWECETPEKARELINDWKGSQGLGNIQAV
jgi:hypothetical protein